MAHRIRPTPLSLRRRIGVFIGRLIMAFFGLIERLRPLPAPSSTISLHRYGSHDAETIQYIPRKAGSPERAPVVYLHGGGWIMGKKELYTRELFFLAEAGHPVFNVEYPVAPENPHPGILLSLLDALRWIGREHPSIDAVHLIGDSAGGNLAMMLGILSANPGLLEDLDPGSSSTAPLACRSVVSLYGVLDRLSWLEHEFPGARLMLECYGGQAAFDENVGPGLSITPMDLQFKTHPPTFLIAGSADPLCESTRIFASRLAAGGGVVRSKIYEGEGHGFFNMSWRPASADLKHDLLAFLEHHDPVRS
ncbi:MAG: alpha/beta hydrolase [Polyangiales bacterium]